MFHYLKNLTSQHFWHYGEGMLRQCKLCWTCPQWWMVRHRCVKPHVCNTSAVVVLITSHQTETGRRGVHATHDSWRTKWPRHEMTATNTSVCVTVTMLARSLTDTSMVCGFRHLSLSSSSLSCCVSQLAVLYNWSPCEQRVLSGCWLSVVDLGCPEHVWLTLQCYCSCSICQTVMVLRIVV